MTLLWCAQFYESITHSALCNHHHNQDTEQFYHTHIHTPNLLMLWLCSYVLPLPPTPGNYQSFVFSRMSYKWNHLTCNFGTDFFHSSQCLCDLFNLLPVSIVCFCLFLNCVPSCGCTIACISTQQFKDIWLLPTFRNFDGVTVTIHVLVFV